MTCLFVALFSFCSVIHDGPGDDLVAATRQQIEALSTLSGRTKRTIRGRGQTDTFDGYFVSRPGYFQAYSQSAQQVSHFKVDQNAVEQYAGAPDKLSGSRGPLARFDALTNQADAFRFAELKLFSPKQKLVWLWQLLDGSEGPCQIVREKDPESGEVAKVKYTSASMHVEVELAAKWNFMPGRLTWTDEVTLPTGKVAHVGKSEFSGFVEVLPGTYFPTKITTSMTENGGEILSIDTSVSNLSADEAEGRKYPPFAFPRGVPITDFNNRSYYKLGADGSKEVITSRNGKPITVVYDQLEKDEMQSPTQAKIAAQAALGPTGASQPSSFPWLWLGVGGAFILLTVVLFRRYRAAT